MANDPRYVGFKPGWWPGATDDLSLLADTPETGFEPPPAPRLPTRILPSRGESGLSANTLSNAIAFTQRILNYVSYEVVHGIQPDFSDLRLADQAVQQLAKLTVEPFEQGSFVIPAALTDKEIVIDNKAYSSLDVLDRFSQVMGTVGDPRSPASLGLVQAIEELGRITRAEAERIEYYPTRPASQNAIVIDEAFIESVRKSKRERQNPISVPDELVGVITAVDLVRASFRLRLEGGTITVRGKFEGLIQDRMTRVLSTKVLLSGIVEYRNNQPHFMRAFSVEFVDS